MTLPSTDSTLEAWTLTLARPTIAPAGGSAAAITAAMAAALVAMVAGMTLDRGRYAAVHADATRLRDAAEQSRAKLLELASEDAQVFAEFGNALNLPTTTDTERTVREEAKRQALAEGARVQLDVMRLATDIAINGEHLATIAPPSTAGDVGTAVFLATSAARSAYWAARSDLGVDAEGSRELLRRAETAQQHLTDLLTERF